MSPTAETDMPKFVFKNKTGLKSEEFQLAKCRLHCRPSKEYLAEQSIAIKEALTSPDPISSLIKLYNEKVRENAEFCLKNKWSIADCLSGCHNISYPADRSTHTHRHQNRLYRKTKAVLPEIIAGQEYDPKQITDFEKLYEWVKQSFDKYEKESDLSEYKRAAYPRQVTIYDTALRLGYHNASGMIVPERIVYLHRGALWGARELKRYSINTNSDYLVTDNPLVADCQIPVTAFSSELQRMGARDIEDFLCVFHHALKILADTTNEIPVPVPDVVPIVIC
ncbi:MAG: hypothetical protein K2K84_01530 [Muribaculaceae bacterium]|nr:hypothetical protein [Muribaculaceae bacterium]